MKMIAFPILWSLVDSWGTKNEVRSRNPTFRGAGRGAGSARSSGLFGLSDLANKRIKTD